MKFFEKYKKIDEKYKTIAIYQKKDNTNDNFLIYCAVSFASFVLSIFNLIDGYSQMLVSTSILAVGLAFSAFLSKKFNDTLYSDIIAAVLTGYTFSSFALHGSNEGFAILWIIVLPPIMININRKVGLLFSIYILLFVFVICYTPIKYLLTEYYTKTFLERFPTLCILDFFLTLYIWAQSTYAEKELAVKTYVDELTGLYNRSFYNLVCDYIENNNIQNQIAMVVMDVNGLKPVNDKYGHLVGDVIIRGAGSIISNVAKNPMAVCRIGGDEFVAIINCDKEDISQIDNKFIELQEKWTSPEIDSISVSYGVACYRDYPNKTLEELYNIADEKMYTCKTKYYLEKKINRRHSQRRVADRRKKDLLNE